ncbi:uncharacterized protein LOC120291446 [Eucalyptus grandis]|uniref:uncharacterized protein LOC120291446 n=1 Tax=Eucalyptus grandis TaxID=71139 RepID=UPI00192E75F6|nr:uncharacterized protein LOC120291446 [Eucalyptus grandis]
MGDAEADRKLLVVTATVGTANGGASTWVVLAQGMAGRVAVTGGAAGRSFAAEVERRRSRNRGNLGAKNSWRRSTEEHGELLWHRCSGGGLQTAARGGSVVTSCWSLR